MDNLQKLISISSGIKEIDKAKKLGFINMDIVNLYQTYAYYLDFTKDKEIFEKENVELWNKIEELQLSYSGKLCTFKAKLPSTFDSFTDDEITSGSGLVKPVVGSFTITDFSQQTLFGSGATYSTHNFTQAEFEAVYSDQDNDTAFYALVIYRDDMNEGNLKFNATSTTGATYDDGTTPITILYADVPKWSFYSNSTSFYTHSLNFQLVDSINNIQLESNTATITMDRTAADGNQPPTIGDSALKALNRFTTPITTAMVTSGLTPPYNDPEGDLIDAIRIDEISTANKGVFQYNSVNVIVGQIIDKADLDANLFTHVGADSNDVETDAINFSVRDAGSLIWVQ